MKNTKPKTVNVRPTSAMLHHARAVVVGDTHVPWHDPGALALAHRVIAAARPSHIVQIGDWADCESISNHPKSPARRQNLATELDIAREKLADFRGCSDVFHMTLGNHEFRLERYIAQRAPELFGLVSVPELLGLSEHEITPYKGFYHIGRCAFTHDCGYSGIHALHHTLAAYSGNICIGHTHRGQHLISGDMRGESHMALNVGWLGDPESIDYTYKTIVKNWHHGIGIVDFDASGNCWGQFVPFVNRSAMVDGQRIV